MHDGMIDGMGAILPCIPAAMHHAGELVLAKSFSIFPSSMREQGVMAAGLGLIRFFMPIILTSTWWCLAISHVCWWWWWCLD